MQVKWRMSAKVKFFQLGAARWKYPENTLAGESIYMGHSSRQGWRVGSIKIFHAIFSIGHLSLSSKHRAWLHQIDDAIFLYLPKEPPLFPLTPFPPGLTQHLHLRWCEENFQRMYSRTWERAAFLRLHSSPNQGVGKLWAKLDAVPKLSPLFLSSFAISTESDPRWLFSSCNGLPTS